MEAGSEAEGKNPEHPRRVFTMKSWGYFDYF
jgi:hypothetical protein